MISAEHLALRNNAVKDMLKIRERSLNYMTEKISHMSTQAALLAGFILTGLQSVPTLNCTNCTIELRMINLLACLIALGAACHVILHSTFMALWGPGIALEGATGSVSLALAVMREQRYQVYFSFLVVVVGFYIQSITAFFILDTDNKGWSMYTKAATIIMGFTTLFIAVMCIRIYTRLSVSKIFKPGQAQYKMSVLPSKASGLSKANDNAVPLMKTLASHPDWGTKSANERKDAAGRSETTMMQRLNHPSYMKGELSKLGANNQWKTRYVVLSGTQFEYWNFEEDAKARKPSNKRHAIVLKGYQVTLNPDDHNYGLTLSPIMHDDPRRTWMFRASTEDLRVRWTEAFVSACLLANNDASA